MRKFLAIYTGTEESFEKSQWSKLSPEDMKKKQQEGMQAWGQWGQEHQKAIIDMGSPIGKTKRVDKSGVKDSKNTVTGYVIIQAESHEEAAQMFKNHPHFSIFPGDAVEIMPCLDLSEM